MNTLELAEKMFLKELTSVGENNPKEITGCYICDLLSRVINGCDKGNVWITVQSSINVAAVAVLNECACVIVCEGVKVSDDVIKKANEEKVIIFSDKRKAYELSKEISLLIT